MKKVLLLSVVLSFCSLSLFAQHRAIGLRLSNAVEVSYQREAGSANFWEFDGGLWNFGNGAQASALYNWIIASPDWTSKGDWNWYLGVGGSTGLVWGNEYHHGSEDVGCFIGVAGMCGLEFNFWFPLTVSADFRPVLGPYFGDGVTFYGKVLYSAFWPTLSARYNLR